MTDRRFYEAPADGARRSAPAALRNREPIADVLAGWLPRTGLVLEVASGTGEHVIHFAGRFPDLDWQPSDINPDSLSSIAAWRAMSDLGNVRVPLALDSTAPNWPLSTADAILSINMLSDRCESHETAVFSVVLCINMVHISPWTASLGLLDGSARVLQPDGALILYGPWMQAGVPTTPSNLAFDQQLRATDPAWGLRSVEDFEAEAVKRGFVLEQVRSMPAHNLMLLLRLPGPDEGAGSRFV